VKQDIFTWIGLSSTGQKCFIEGIEVGSVQRLGPGAWLAIYENGDRDIVNTEEEATLFVKQIAVCNALGFDSPYIIGENGDLILIEDVKIENVPDDLITNIRRKGYTKAHRKFGNIPVEPPASYRPPFEALIHERIVNA
jgi:hypothetical protein